MSQQQHFYGGNPPQGGGAPPQGDPGHQPPYGPGGPGYPQGGPPPPGQPPYQQQQPFYNYPPGQGPPPPGQYGQQYGQQYGAPGGPYGQQQGAPYGQPPPGPYGQQPGAPYGQQPVPPYGQQPGAPYGQQPFYPPQPQAQQWGQPPPPQGMQPYGYNAPPTPASPGYDPAQKATAQHVDTSSDIEALRKAMKGMGCDERALIRVFTNSKYANPWAMAQLVKDYNSRFMRDLAKDIESETRGDFETALIALIRGPLENDARVLEKALNRAGTDEEALNDVLLCRSNADLRAISAEYKRVKSADLLSDIKDDVDDTLFRLYSMVLSATRAEAAAPVNPQEVDHKVTELQRSTEGTLGANAVSVAQIFVSSNDAQLRAINEAYQKKYHRGLQDVIKKEFRGDMEDVLLRILLHAVDPAGSDAANLKEPLMKTVRNDRLLINRVVTLYWNRTRLEEVKAAYKKKYGITLGKDLKQALSGDYEDLMMALVGDK